MDVREKLIDLILDAKRTDPETGRFTEYLADYLVSNDVTVQEWISVDDRLPEPKENAICINRYGSMMIGVYTEWGWMFPCYFEEPTHWMPIPQPPKGE